MKIDFSLWRWIVVGVTVALLLSFLGRMLAGSRSESPFDLERFGELPVQIGGRVKPLEGVARTQLLLLSGRSTVTLQTSETSVKRTAIEWLAETFLNPQSGVHWPVIRIDHPEVVALLGKRNEEQQYFSLAEIAPHFQTLSQAWSELDPESEDLGSYERALLKLRDGVGLYDTLIYTLIPPAVLGSALEDYTALSRAQADLTSPDADPAVVETALNLFRGTYDRLAATNRIGVIPSGETLAAGVAWQNLGEALLQTLNTPQQELPPLLLAYAQLARAYQQVDAEGFAATLEEIEALHAASPAYDVDRVHFEAFYTRFSPFTFCFVAYLLAFVLAALSWLVLPRTLGPLAFWIVVAAFLFHTFGIGARMYIQQRPPVTTLYSSAVFIGWAGVGFALILELFQRNRFLIAAACLIGFATLIIAPSLERQEGDTMGVMRAVLDSNFWLATHVPTITLGYAATFLAGGLAILFLLGSWLGLLSKERAREIHTAVYAIVCFALLFSFVGTVLGGIWADQSWGRFWGWDPKENGALMIVLWNAVILHARWGKLASPRGIMQMAIFGNIITAWSWFGTNMLGAGLHSYGFIDQAFAWLMIFIVSQLVLIGIGWLPPRASGKAPALAAPAPKV